MGKYVCHDLDRCQLVTARGDNVPVSHVTIDGTVGAGGRNQQDDVRSIQQALNQIPAGDGGAADNLTIDGLCGPRTTGAIRHFQSVQFPGWTPDSRIDPQQKTIAKINELLANPRQSLRLSLNPDTMPPEIQRAHQCVPGVLSRIRAARRRVIAARSALSSGIAGGLAAKDVETVRWHFKFHRAPDPISHLSRVIAVYDRMESVLFMETRPSSPFQLFQTTGGNPREKNAAAWAALGGYSYGLGEKHRDGEYYHAIYIAPQFAEKVYAEMILLHELAHFCGGRFGSSDAIGHRAHPKPHPRGQALEDGSRNYASMSAHDALCNAQSFQFLCAPEHEFFAPPNPLPAEAK